MIFVTVGTHEQQFNRLIKYVDRMESDEEIIIQRGYSDYEPRNCKWEDMMPYPQMVENVKAARIVITHGGPSSIMMPLQMGKIPIVVPRQKKFGEHVNDHQVEFIKKISETAAIIPVYDIDDLKDIIDNYDSLISENVTVSCNNERFNREFKKIVDLMFGRSVK